MLTNVAGKLAEIAQRYEWHNRRQKNRPSIMRLRMRQIERLIGDRYGSSLPDSEAGRTLVRIAINHLSAFPFPERQIVGWLGRWAPWWDGDTQPKWRPWIADELAGALNVIAEERWRLKLWTIGAIDCPKAERLRRRRKKAKLRERARRAKKRSQACAV
jgi:hypothetical protein